LRSEDFRFLTGHGQFVDDIAIHNAAHGYVLRSPHAHARIRSIDITAALRAPSVLLVLTGADVKKDGLGELESRFFPPRWAHRPTQPVLVSSKVRHVGDRVAFVVAETLSQSKDAAELIEVDYEVLPAAADPEDALVDGAPLVWDDATSNVSFRVEKGDQTAVNAAFAKAAHVTKLLMRYPRASANPIEPRATIGLFDRYQNRYTLHAASQAPFRPRDMIAARILHIPESNLRVVAPDIGGGFGMKGAVYPEDVLVVWAAGKIDRPVKWSADRSESFISDMHGRDLRATAEMALDNDGRILAVRADFVANVGAYLGYAAGAPAMAATTNISSVYDVPLIYATARAVFTNTPLLGPYRGSGRPEATYVIERLIDKAAREMSIDSVSIRRRNLVPASAMPYQTPGGHTYDSGDFSQMLDMALKLADWDGFPARRIQSQKKGRLRGIGIGMHCEFSGLQSERMEMRVDQNGSITVLVGTLATGQGHETMYAQMVSDWLGVPMTHIRILQGDTDRVLFGRGTYAERSATVGGAALRFATDDLVQKGKRIAAWMLEAEERQIEFDNGLFRMKQTNKSVGLRDVAHTAYAGHGLPKELGLGLDGVGVSEGTPSYPNGCIICELELDPETGKIQLEKMSVADDVGIVINPLMLDGQLSGSIAQGIGQILNEEIVYDRQNGQLLSGSFMDYGMPRADDMPPVEAHFATIPAKTNPLGIKGGSEAGNIAAPPAIVNAVVDALSSLGIVDIALPIRSERVWQAIKNASTDNSSELQKRTPTRFDSIEDVARGPRSWR
jgi:carbon-monoxide dehydrogenase large subunit